MYELHTNEGKFYLTDRPTTEQMSRYIRAKRSMGWRLNEIVFCYGRINVGKNCDYLVRAQEDKALKQAHKILTEKVAEVK